MHSAMYERIKKYYDTGLWSKSRVWNMVDKGIVTEAEYEEITGEAYRQA